MHPKDKVKYASLLPRFTFKLEIRVSGFSVRDPGAGSDTKALERSSTA